MTVTEPGIYRGMPAVEYHADPVPAEQGGSLSHSGAKTLLHQTPAHYQWQRTHPVYKDAFDLGHCVHDLLLGAGGGVHVVDATTWQTNAAKAARSQARAEGKAPVLRKDFLAAVKMVRAVRRHPIAGALFADGEPEVPMFWQDEASGGVWLRAMADWFTTLHSGRPCLVDFKTTGRSANPTSWERPSADFHYHGQHPWYVDGAPATGLADDPAFLFVIAETEPPHLVSVVELTPDAVETGRRENRAAIDLYAQCVSDNHWPGYPVEVAPIDLPYYYRSPSTATEYAP